MKRFVVAAAAAISLVGAAPAAAQSTFEVGMEDEGIFLANQHLAPGAAAAWKQCQAVPLPPPWWTGHGQV